ncbi:MAG: twin-arginine translocation signal domain-containing protein, partial [Planctomycetaceae bacterium]|nr:twin-arginine translocation signal domain-containing protein [Planctomycetaceae bacterium]
MGKASSAKSGGANATPLLCVAPFFWYNGGNELTPLYQLMTNRRNFLKSLALLGAAATLPVQKLFAQNTAVTPKPVGEGMTKISYATDIQPARKPPRNITIPDVGAPNGEQYKVLKGDFHMHTLFSDGSVMPRDRVVEAVDNGLDMISITDHVEYRPNIGSTALRLAENNDNHNRSYDLAKAE